MAFCVFDIECIMKKLHKVLLFIFFLAFLLLLSSVAPQEVDDEKEFSYDSGSEKGPEHWGKLNDTWRACGYGLIQSPINITNERVKETYRLGRLRRAYRPGNAVMKNRRHDIMIRWDEEAGGIWVNRIKYLLKQLHWHSPSEHTINGHRYSLELHMVHQSAENKFVVVAILYTIGRPDSFLDKMKKYIEKMKGMDEDEEEIIGLVDPRAIKYGSRKYYRYFGSLTTPPCTEGVIWTIIKKVRTVSRAQVTLLKEAVHDLSGYEMNARPLQKINKRMIGLYRPQKIQS